MRHSTTKNIISAFVFGAAMAAGAYYACKLLCSSEKFNTAKRNFEKMMKDKINNCKCKADSCSCDCDTDENNDECNCDDDCYIDNEIENINDLQALDGVDSNN